jgi:transcriptional repressor NrdR
MVCIYCGAHTSVVNSRHQRRTNTIWRRRKCERCASVFTSIEQPDLQAGLRIRRSPTQLVTFDRDRLFISIYECCRHRPAAVHEAGNLAQQVINGLLTRAVTPGLIDREDLVTLTYTVLKGYDRTAAALYSAYHPGKS